MKESLKFHLSLSLCFAALFLLSILTISCKDNDPLTEMKAKLIGTWQAIPTAEYKPYKELFIEFKSDQTIGLYEPYLGEVYNLIDESSLTIGWKGSSVGYVFALSYNTDHTITIYRMEDGDPGPFYIKNITFKKIR